ncbi:MAG: SpoIIE family protein phosphatase [Rhodospirillaceae bacterium]|nr:SpoIIE family protein phosphatase [Rhodospirillaceae bacterium]
MRIQSKLFLLLIVIAVVPLIALTWRSQRATESLGTTIIAQGRLATIGDIEVQLSRVVDYSSDVLAVQQRLVEMALRLQASEVERRLAAEPPATPVPVYMSAAFESGKTWPPGTVMSLDRTVVTDDRVVAVLPISDKHQSFLMPAGVEPDPLETAKLASMDSVYARLNASNPGLFYWQYITLASGLHSSFPGHGGYPESYDPRQRAWYKLAIAKGDLIWTPPLWDAATRRLLLTAAMPVRSPDGAVLGVTGIDVEILSVLNKIHDKIKLGTNAASFIVRLAGPDGAVYAPNDEAPLPTLRVVASSSSQNSSDNWNADVAEPDLVSDKPGAVNVIINDFLEGRGGFRRMPYQGKDSIWVYRQLERLSTGLLYIVPVGDVESIADLAQESVRDATMEQVRLAGGASVGLIILVALAAMLISRSITGPLRSLAATARGLAAGDLEARAPVTSRDEVGELANVFNAMIPELRTHIKTKESLAVARDVQQKLLPASAPVVPGVEAAGLSVYSEAVGGDYYDFLCLTDEAGDKRLGVVVGDVTGHGIPAALTMTSVRALVRSHSDDGLLLLPVMRAVNRHVAADTTRGNFVTLVYMVIEPDTRLVRWISAGHGPILFYNGDTYGFEELEVHDIPLGVKAEWTFHELSRSAWPSSGVLVIGTDGIWESRNAEGRQFGKDNLIGVVRASAHLGAQEICHAIVDRLAEFRGAVAQDDDVTVVVVKFLPTTAA